MCLCHSLDIFHKKMNKLFNGLDYVRTSIMQRSKLDKVLSKLQSAGFKANAEKSFIDRNELKYLGFKIIRECLMSLPDKVEVIKNIAVPTTKKHLRSFL